MSDDKDVRAVQIFMDAFHKAIASIEKEDPEIFHSPDFVKWALISSSNFTCQLAKIGGLDLPRLLENIALTYGVAKKKPLN
jgi:hypothetical protein